MAISTRDLSLMPEIVALRTVLRAVAMLESILANGERVDHDFHSPWEPGVQVAAWDNQQGDNYFVVFDDFGCWIKGFAHEARMSPFRSDKEEVFPGMFKGMPVHFRKWLGEPAFAALEETTFCIWRKMNDSKWRRGDFKLPPHNKKLSEKFQDPDLSGMILSEFERSPTDWADWADEYYERFENPLDREAVTAIFELTPLSKKLVRRISPDASFAACKAAAARIMYPIAARTG